MKLRDKIAASICLIVVLSLVFMCISIYSRSAATLNANVNDMATTQIHRAQENIDLMVKKIKLETISYSRSDLVRKFIEKTISISEINNFLVSEMNKLNTENGYYKDLFIVDKSGTIVASTMPNAMYVDLSSREYIKNGLNGSNVQMSDILLALTDQANIVNTSYPIYDYSGKVCGAFGIAVKAEEFTRFANNYEIGNSGYFAIIGSDGYILSHKDPNLINKLASEYIADIETKIYNDEDIYNSSDDSFLYMYKIMESNNWLLLTAVPKKELHAKSIELLKYVLLYGSITIVCSIILCIFLSNKISTPIINITNYINDAKNINDTYGNIINKSVIEYDLGFFNKDAQKLIKKSNDLTKSLKLKTYITIIFMSVLSHDIRSSLTLIKGYAKGILSGMVTDEETKLNFIEQIYQSADTLEKISYDVLDSTYEAQTIQKLNTEKINIIEFANDLDNIAKSIVEHNDRIYSSNISVNNGFILADRVKLIRVWQNLLNNAVKYTDMYKEISVYIEQNDNHVKIMLKDTGKGIKEIDKQYIFEMFYKSDFTQNKSYGLGLFIAKSIIEAHNSKIEFESTENKGSSFWFCLQTTE